MVRVAHSRSMRRVVIDADSEALSPAEARDIANRLVEAAALVEADCAGLIQIPIGAETLAVSKEDAKQILAILENAIETGPPCECEAEEWRAMSGAEAVRLVTGTSKPRTT